MPRRLREAAQDIEHPCGVEVTRQGTENGTCRAEVTTDLSEDAVLTPYESQLEANGWETATATSGMGGIAGTKEDVRFEVGWVQPPGEDAAIILTLEPAG